jgi:hypothetical protein
MKDVVLPPSKQKHNYKKRADQSNLSLTKFIENNINTHISK